MIKHAWFAALLTLLIAPLASAQPNQIDASTNQIELGQLASLATVTFVRAGSGDWSIEISGSTAQRMAQQKPAQIEVFAGGENVRQLSAGSTTGQRTVKFDGITGLEIPGNASCK